MAREYILQGDTANIFEKNVWLLYVQMFTQLNMEAKQCALKAFSAPFLLERQKCYTSVEQDIRSLWRINSS